MVCPKCGEANRDGENFCQWCGEPLGTNNVQDGSDEAISSNPISVVSQEDLDIDGGDFSIQSTSLVPQKAIEVRDSLAPVVLDAQGRVIEVASKISYKAVFSFVFGILAFMGLPLIGSILAIVWGNQARSEIRRSNGRLRGEIFAKSGLFLVVCQV